MTALSAQSGVKYNLKFD